MYVVEVDEFKLVECVDDVFVGNVKEVVVVDVDEGFCLMVYIDEMVGVDVVDEDVVWSMIEEGV